MNICNKEKKRKVFDVTKMRVQGTEAESYVRKKPVQEVKLEIIYSKMERIFCSFGLLNRPSLQTIGV